MSSSSVFVPSVAEWALAFISCGLTHHLLLRRHHAARERLGMGDLDMADIAKIVFFILACAFLFSLTAFLFRDQITSRRRVITQLAPEVLEPIRR